MKKICTILACVFILALDLNVHAEGVINNSGSVCEFIQSGKIHLYSANGGTLYTGEINGTGVRFRKSPYLKSNNVIRTFAKGEKIWVYQTGINVAYNDGYYWSYVKDKNGKYGYVASNYFATDGINKIIGVHQ